MKKIISALTALTVALVFSAAAFATEAKKDEAAPAAAVKTEKKEVKKETKKVEKKEAKKDAKKEAAKPAAKGKKELSGC